MDVYLEIGKKRTFAGAIEWPGWCRSGRGEQEALQALLDSAPRYREALAPARLGFKPPKDPAALKVVERLEGNATTDFGAPALPPSADEQPVEAADIRRFQKLMDACFNTLAEAAAAAGGKELRKGPRGGGRELDGILNHVTGSMAVYLSSIGWKFKHDEVGDAREELERARQAVQEGLAAAGRGELPTVSPRGKVYWTPRYFVRRSAWHVLDHVWEIEDRIL
jgi:hypothetical protein